MSDPVSPAGSRVTLALSERGSGPSEAATWIGSLVALGGMASRHNHQLSGRQLVVALSVPRRDFAAALVGCGWVLASPDPQIDPPLAVLRNLEAGAPVRLVTGSVVIADHFVRLDEEPEPRVHLRGGTQWLVSKVRAVAPLPALATPARSVRPKPGSVARWAGREATWDERLASPAADLAIIGTLKWLQEDFVAFLAIDGESIDDELLRSQEPTGSVAGLLLPESPPAATWFTRLYASSHLAEQLPLPKEVRGAILDGAAAIKYLAEIEAPVVICILDRSVADETAAETVVQLRNSRGEPLSLKVDLDWRPPAGVEALAFTAAL